MGVGVRVRVRVRFRLGFWTRRLPFGAPAPGVFVSELVSGSGERIPVDLSDHLG